MATKFERYDSAYLESLSDEEFFAPRFSLSDSDRKTLEENSRTINGRPFYRHKVLEKIEKNMLQ